MGAKLQTEMLRTQPGRRVAIIDGMTSQREAAAAAAATGKLNGCCCCCCVVAAAAAGAALMRQMSILARVHPLRKRQFSVGSNFYVVSRRRIVLRPHIFTREFTLEIFSHTL